MTGTLLTQAATTPALADSDPRPVAQSRAARELGLTRSEFDVAVRLGRIRTVADAAGGRRRVTVEEIERVRTAEGFPHALRRTIEVVGTTEGARLMGISSARFTRLARLGLLVPVHFSVNRYRAVVWLYLAEELREFADADANTDLLRGRVPASLQEQLTEGVDLRARNWRGRHAGFLLRRTEDTWERAAAVASLLDPGQVSEMVPDPCERAYLDRLRPEAPGRGAAESPTAQTVTTAGDADEILWMRANLALALAEARQERMAPRPEPRAGTAVPKRSEREVNRAAEPPRGLPGPGRPGSLRGWMRRRKRASCPSGISAGASVPAGDSRRSGVPRR